MGEATMTHVDTLLGRVLIHSDQCHLIAFEACLADCQALSSKIADFIIYDQCGDRVFCNFPTEHLERVLELAGPPAEESPVYCEIQPFESSSIHSETAAFCK